MRDKYVPGDEMWVIESGDAGGGDIWVFTYLDVLAHFERIGRFRRHH